MQTPGYTDRQDTNIAQDLIRGLGYGTTESLRSVYGLVDYIDDNTSINILPSWDKPLVSKPDSFTGNLVGGATQFLLPFGAIGKVSGAVGAALQSNRILAPAGKSLSWFSGKSFTSAADAADKAIKAGKGSQAFTRAILAGKAVSSGAARGAVTDFIAFEGASTRLSDIVQGNPTLANPLTAWLSSDETDGELEGRFKNLLEGAFLGGAFDMMFAWRRGFKASNAVKASGGDEAAQATAFADAADTGLRERADLARVERDSQMKLEEGLEVSLPQRDGEDVILTGKQQEKAARETAQELVEAAAEDVELQIKGLPAGLAKRVKAATKRAKDELDDATRIQTAFDGLEGATNIKRKPVGKLADNLSMLQDEQGLSRLMRAIEEADVDSFVKDKTTNDSITADALSELQDLVGLSSSEKREGAMLFSRADAAEVRKFTVRARAARVVSIAVFDDLAPLFKELTGREALNVDHARLISSRMRGVKRLIEYPREIYSEFGRGLQSASASIDPKAVKGQIENSFTFGPLEILDDLTREFDEGSFRGILDDLHKLTQSPDAIENIRAIKKWTEASATRKFQDGAVEYYINSLLSGPTTHAVNTMSGIAMSFFRPLENMIAGAVSSLSRDDALKQAGRSLWRTEAGTVMNLLSDMTEARSMFKMNGADAFVKTTKFDGGSFSPLKQAAQGKNKLFSHAADVVSLPSRLLGAEDKFIKSLNGRSQFRAVAKEKLAQSGVDVRELDGIVNDMLDSAMDSRGRIREHTEIARAIRKAADEGGSDLTPLLEGRARELLKFDDEQLEILLEANDAAITRGAEATFTTELSDSIFGTTGKAIQTVAEKHPAIKFFLPFVRTPVNIAEFGWDRSIGAVLGSSMELIRQSSKLIPGVNWKLTERSITKLQRELASPDNAVRAHARLRMTYGLVTVGTIMHSVMNTDETDRPRITGSGPSNPAVRKSLELTGWQPNSILIRGKYVSYSRLDPFASILATSVDAADYIKASVDENGEATASALTLSLAVGAANNLTSKTYAQGLSNLLNLVTDPEESGERVLGATLGGFIPTAVAGVERTLDPELQEVRSAMDVLMSRMPGLSDKLPTRRNIMGEAMEIEAAELSLFNPFRISTVKDSKVNQELGRFAYGFRMPLTTKQGVDLLEDSFSADGQTAYDRYLELTGTTTVQGMSLRQALRKEFGSTSYSRLNPDDGPNGENSPRLSRINSIFRKYRDRAWKDLQRERPNLRSEIRRRSKERAQFRRPGVIRIPGQ